MKESIKSIKKAFSVTVILLVICGFVYPLLMTGMAQTFFSHQANGSLILADDKAVGSELIGQDFTKPFFMKCRPSAVNYNTYTEEEKKDGSYGGVASGSQNYSPSNPALIARVRADMDNFLKQNPTVKREDIPADLMTASGSGLDPHISPESAEIQLERLAEASGLSIETLKEIVSKHTETKLLGVFGQDRVNVLKVNLEIAKQLGLINSIE